MLTIHKFQKFCENAKRVKKQREIIPEKAVPMYTFGEELWFHLLWSGNLASSIPVMRWWGL